jgi:hypothetical protein
LIWLTGQLAPDIKTIADLRTGKAIRAFVPIRPFRRSIYRFIFWFGERRGRPNPTASRPSAFQWGGAPNLAERLKLRLWSIRIRQPQPIDQ